MLNNDGPLDPLALYRAATDRAIAVIEGVGSDQFGSPTPCTEWTVQQVVDHLAGGTEYLLSVTRGREPVQPTNATAADYRRGVADALNALEQPGVLERTCMSPIGFEWTIAQAVIGTCMDVVIHTWDIARATGQDEKLDPDIVEACTATFLPDMPERGREAGIIGPAVEVGDDASPQDRLLAAMGRRP